MFATCLSYTLQSPAPVPSGGVPTVNTMIQFVVKTEMVKCPVQTLPIWFYLPLKIKEFDVSTSQIPNFSEVADVNQAWCSWPTNL